MSYENLCNDVLLMTPQVVAVIVEHRDGYRVCEKIRKEIIKIDEERKLFALMKGARLVEDAKEYRQELGKLHVIVHQFDNLVSFIFPLRDNHCLVVVLAPPMTEFKPFIAGVTENIKKNDLIA